MNRLLSASLATACFAATAAFAQDVIVPKANLVVDGLPPIPSETARKVAPYTEFRPSALASWHPTKREMLIRQRLKNTGQVHLVKEPGAKPEPLTDFPDAVSGGNYEPNDGNSFSFVKSEGGNEVFRIYRYEFATKAVAALTPEGERAGSMDYARKGRKMSYTTQSIDKNDASRKATTKLYLSDPLKPTEAKVITTLDGGGWFGFQFSEDEKQLVYLEYKSANESDVWVMDIATAKARKITTQPPGEQVAYGDLKWSKDGKGVYLTTDKGSEFTKLAYLPLDGGALKVLAEPKFDVTTFQIDEEGNRLAYITNENGTDVLRLYDLKAGKELPRPALMQGIIAGLEWRRNSDEIGFTLVSARSAGDVFSYDVKTNKTTRWTNGNVPELNTSEFAEPKLVKWKSFDGLEISGFHYAPPAAKFPGKRPVIINVHGGPEAQSRAGFIGRNNYFVNEMGVALIFPNVRGSAGFGKTFLKLDNGRKREDSVKDLGALIDWIKTQPDLDADKVLITGGSYGGYMAFASSVLLADRIAGAISVVGISNFVTFLERTETYRRDLRRVEYGDERDPEMRKFLETISPLNHADKMTKPLFVVQGFNDPRVPYTEAEQIVATMKKKNRPVWFLMAKDEGHGFAKKDNADFQFAATVEFVRATLLK